MGVGRGAALSSSMSLSFCEEGVLNKLLGHTYKRYPIRTM